MSAITIHSPPYAGYTKVVLLTLEEKGVEYHLKAFDFPDRPQGFEKLNPFNKVPVIEHDGFVLYEVSAIARYIDEGFDGPPLQPEDLKSRARMNQIIAIMDQVGAPDLLRTVYSQRFVEKVHDGEPDEGAIAAALSRSEITLSVLDQFASESPFLAGLSISLADFFVMPNFAYFADTKEGEQMLADHPSLAAWLDTMKERPSVQKVGLPDLPAPKTFP